MRRFVLGMATATATAIAFLASAANADETFNWSYTDDGTNVGGGTLTAKPTGIGDGFLVTDIAGIANGLNITGLSSYDFPDQLIFYSPPLPPPAPSEVNLDRDGLSFAVTGGDSFQLYEDDGGYTPGPPYGCGGIYCLIGPGTAGPGDPFVTVGFSLTPVASGVPEPITLSIFGAGLVGAAAMRRRRKKAKA